jgi:hypothetical protein
MEFLLEHLREQKRMLNLHILAALQYSFRSQAMHNSHIFYPKMYGTDPVDSNFPE